MLRWIYSIAADSYQADKDAYELNNIGISHRVQSADDSV